ncbi:MAG: PPOX class F420-dependent oxidoreductase [Dehalococcoidia bacterium]|nr:PPOX class F420-dependent oxidoreductase [Dehalococcoidia bacterium]
MQKGDFARFKDERFLSLETFRKSGVGVKTPVWFAQEGDALYVWTVGDSGKVKRIRNNPRVNIAPCKRFGKVTGEWVPAQASVDASDAAVRHVEALLRRKLGLEFAVFRLVDRLRDRRRKSRRVCVKVSLSSAEEPASK